jgi:hypothetical protein
VAQFSSGSYGVAGTANATNLPLWVLTQLTAGNIAKVRMFSWGGGDTSLISYQTVWAKVSNTPITPTALVINCTSPGTGITGNATCNTYGTVAARTANSSLYQAFWNSQGGGGTIVLPIGGEWFVSGGALGTAYNQIGCGNVTGASANTTFGLQWEE